MDLRLNRGRGAGRLLLLLALAVLVAAALASPAAAVADPVPTKLTVTAQKKPVYWGSKGILNGILQTAEAAPRPLDQQQIVVQYAVDPDGPWQTAGTVTNSAAPYSSGEYTYLWKASRTYWWKMVFAGSDEWGASESKPVKVGVMPVVGKPKCPKNVRRGWHFTVSGSLKPCFAGGSKTIKVVAERKVGGKWKKHKTYQAVNLRKGTEGRYRVKIKIKQPGRYRFYARSAKTVKYVASTSARGATMRIR